jgi:tetratricopeptide (TPR) repeat protein
VFRPFPEFRCISSGPRWLNLRTLLGSPNPTILAGGKRKDLTPSPHPNTLYNMGMCYYRLRQLDRAMEYMMQTLTQNPEFEAAKAMRIKLKSEALRLKQLAY